MKILNRWDMSIIFECEKETILEAVNKANLRGVNLRGADLRGANLLQINLPFYQVVVQKEYTRIGCEYHSNTEWREFDDITIKAMDSNALVFWNSFKEIIFSAIDSLNKDEK